MSSAEKIYIIDGSGYIFRAYFAIQRLSTSAGFPTNAVYGFVNMLMKVLEVEKPKHLVITFDTSKRTFRKELYADYKANRSAPPDDLVKQIPLIHKAVDCFNIRRMQLDGFEADDIIGTLAKQAEKAGHRVEIITADKDLMQLVNEHVTLYDTMKDKRIDEAAVVEKFGVQPKQVVDFLALMGDTSDNIPGVTGIGEKTAAELINEFGSIDGIYEGIDRIKQAKRKETLLKEKDAAYLSRKLATVHCEAPIDFTLPSTEYNGPDLSALQAFFTELEFTALLKRFNLEGKPAAAEKEFKKGVYTVVRDERALKEMVAKLGRRDEIAVDTETTSLNPHDAKLVGVSLSGSPAEAYYIPVGHYEVGDPTKLAPGQLDPELVKAALAPLLESEKVGKIGQNLKYDLQIFRNWGVSLRGLASDTLLASYLIDPDQSHNLDALALRHLGHKNISYEDVTGSGREQLNFGEVAIDKATEYSGEDADIAFRLNEKLLPEVKERGVEKLLKDVELPLVSVLADMEYRGVLVDRDLLARMGGELETDLGKIQETIYGCAGEPLNINSPKQLSKILFEKLKLPVIRRTKTGISTDESVLQALANEHEICRHILKFRELGKLKSTYVEGLLAQVNSRTGRIHTNYQQTVAATGRLSSTNPNLQNIPVGGDKYDIRAAFLAPRGHLLLSADYSQVELRLLAHMSGDAELTRAFRSGEDVHDFTGRLIFGKDQISSDERRIAKTINFGVTYGQTAFGLSQTLGIAPKDAKHFIDTYFARYPGIRSFHEKLKNDGARDGYVSTMMGRRRYLPDINDKNRMRREMAERVAINAPIQGSAADMIKKAMVSLAARLEREKLAARMILQVHDELVLEVPEKEMERVKPIVCEEMEGAIEISVPLKVDTGTGKSWRECDG